MRERDIETDGRSRTHTHTHAHTVNALAREHPGWVQFENKYWLPMTQGGYTILHKVE